VGRQREGLVRGSDRARDEPVPAERVGRAAGDPGALAVHLEHDVLEAVVGLGDRRGREGVGGDEVGACFQVPAVDVLDHVGPGQVQQVGIPGDVARVVAEAVASVVGLDEAARLDRGAVRAVQHQDPLREQCLEPVPHGPTLPARSEPDQRLAPARPGRVG